jgi:hypothetical protein
MLPRVAADMPLAPAIEELLVGKIKILPWSVTQGDARDEIVALYTYGRPLADRPLLDRLPSLRVMP